MSDMVLITLIVAVAVIILLFMFRRRLSHFGIKANKEGIEAELETRDPSAMPALQLYDHRPLTRPGPEPQ